MAINWTALLANDPNLQSALGAISSQGVADQAALTAARRRAIAQFGIVPTDLSGAATGDVNADIDQSTRDLAAQATAGGISTWAQLQHGANVANANTLSALAARGMLRSGALGTHLNENQLAANQNEYAAHQNLLDQLSGNYQNFLNQQAQGRLNAASATNDALSLIIQKIQAGMYGSGTGTGSKTAAPYPVGPTGSGGPYGGTSTSTLTRNPSDAAGRYAVGNYPQAYPRTTEPTPGQPANPYHTPTAPRLTFPRIPVSVTQVQRNML